MVAITSGKLLITGGSGYVGAWIVKSAVDRGYAVIAAVRTDAQGEFLVNRFPEYSGKVTYTVVPDITKKGAYDDAVKDVDAIIHAASPLVFRFEDLQDPQEILQPAINGALGILESALKFGNNVKRVILTSSITAIGAPADPEGPLVRDETLWNTHAPAELKARGKNIGPRDAYRASKTIAEQSSWAFVKEHAPSWDFATILPSYSWGPYIHQTGNTLGSTPGMLLDRIHSPDTSGALVGDCVDVRDTADIHILALEHPNIGGERVLVRSATYAWQDFYDALNSPEFPKTITPGKDTKGAGKNKSPAILSNAKAVKLWPEFKYRTFETTVKDMGDQLIKGGYIPVVSD